MKSLPKILLGGLLLIFSHNGLCQESPVEEADSEEEEEEERDFNKHHILFGIGHGVVSARTSFGEPRNLRLIPTLGFSYEFWTSEKLGLGLKNEIEVMTYVIEDNEGFEIERENPFSLSLTILYKLSEKFGLFLGPGIEFEANENLSLYKLGAFYELEIRKKWDITTEFTYELKGGHTGLAGISLLFGKKF